jgi:TP901 family phage tail tape measure protein
MARDLDVGFTVFANVRPAEREMKRFRRGIANTDLEMVKFGQNLKRRAGAQSKAFAGAVRGSAFALAGLSVGLLKTAKTAGDYDRQIRLAAFLTKNTEDAFAGFDTEVKSIASDLGILPTEIAKAGQAVGRLGFRGEAAAGVLRQSATLAAASLGELAGPQAVGAIGTALRSFGQDASQAGAVSDALTNSVNNTSLNFKKLPLALGTSAGFAAAFGSDLNTLLGILGAVNDVIPRTERAATGVRNIFRDLSKDTTKAKLAQAGLNLQITDAGGNFRDIIPIMEELFAQTDKMTEAQRLQTFQTAFSVEAATTLAALQERLKTGFEGTNGAVVGGTEGLRMLIGQMGDSGSASALAEEKLKGFAGAMDKFKTEGTLLAVEIGKALNTTLVPAIQFVTGIISSLRETIAGLSPGAKTMIGVFGTIAVVLGIVAGGLIAASLAMGSWTFITGIATTANLAFLASLGPIAIAIGVIVGLVVIFWKQIKFLFAQLIKFRAFVNFRELTDDEQAQVARLEGRTNQNAESADAEEPRGRDAILASAASEFLPARTERRAAEAAEAVQERLASGRGPAGQEREVAREIAAAPEAGDINISLEMDSKKMGDAIITRQQRERRRTFRRLPTRI